MIEVSPPSELAELTQALGPEMLLALLERFGGTRVYVPNNPRQDKGGRMLVMTIGLPGAINLSALYGGGNLKVPLAKHWRARLYRARGMTYAAIAKRLGTTEETARMMANRTADTLQLSLF